MQITRLIHQGMEKNSLRTTKADYLVGLQIIRQMALAVRLIRSFHEIRK